MPQPSPSRSNPEAVASYVQSPVVILPPAKPGGTSRRVAIKPSKAFLLLGFVFVLGGAATAVTLGWLLREVQTANEQLASEMEILRAEVSALKAAPTAADPLTAPSEPDLPLVGSAPQSGRPRSQQGHSPVYSLVPSSRRSWKLVPTPLR